MTERRAGGQEPTERALVELGRAIAYPPAPEIAPRVRARIEARRRVGRTPSRSPWPGTARWPAWLWVAVAALAALTMILAAPRTREAVAELFGLRGVRFGEAPAASPAPVDGTPDAARSGVAPFPGEPVSLAEARGRVGFSILLPAALGPPDAVLAGSPAGAGHVTLLYGPRAGLPRTATPEFALAFTQFRGDAEPFIAKGIPTGARLERVMVGGARGYWLEGAHPVQFQEPGGAIRSDAPRLAGNTLLWQRGGITYRLESGLSRDEAIRMAESVR